MLWVITGDLPPAYLVTDDAPDWQGALAAYAGEMRKWVAAVRDGSSTADLIPVNVTPTAEHAAMLERRLDFIERELIAAPTEVLRATCSAAQPAVGALCNSKSDPIGVPEERSIKRFKLLAIVVIAVATVTCGSYGQTSTGGAAKEPRDGRQETTPAISLSGASDLISESGVGGL